MEHLGIDPDGVRTVDEIVAVSKRTESDVIKTTGTVGLLLV